MPFDAKNFNAEVFTQYYESLPNLKLNQLIQSGAVKPRPDLAQVMSDQVGGNYITTPLLGRIGGEAVNYDGSTDITADSTKTYTQSRVVVGRAKAWVERDFSYDVTGGEDFMANVAAQVNDYWTGYDQHTLLNILAGVFAMSDTNGQKFVDAHTANVTEVVNAEGTKGHLDATTLNSAIQKALGDNKNKFALVVMHSAVATNLENLKLLTYAKMNDAEGLQRDVALATLNGRLVLIDDDMPTAEIAEVKDGETVTTAAGTAYTTYVLGEGAIEITDCGAKVPFEMARDPKTNGGQDTLYTRQRKCIAPYGISFTKSSMAGLSPTDAELAKGQNWKLANSNESTAEFIDHKAIPICRIISRG